MIVYALAYLLIAGYFLNERFTRKGGDAKDLRRTRFDKGSSTAMTAVMSLSFGLLAVSPLLNHYNLGGFQNLPLSVNGLVLSAFGLTLRHIAFRALGRFFTRTLRESEGQTLVTNGIYRYIRHPGYLANLLFFIGSGVAMHNYFVAATIAITFIAAYCYRIPTEEKMLEEIFGEQYTTYKKSTKRLIPFLF